MAITYTKLRDGSWGIRAEGTEVQAGTTVTVAKKSGETKRETVGKVLWSGDGITLATIAANGGSHQATSGRGRNVCAECGKGGRLVADLEDGLMKHYNCCDIPPG